MPRLSDSLLDEEYTIAYNMRLEAERMARLQLNTLENSRPWINVNIDYSASPSTRRVDSSYYDVQLERCLRSANENNVTLDGLPARMTDPGMSRCTIIADASSGWLGPRVRTLRVWDYVLNDRPGVLHFFTAYSHRGDAVGEGDSELAPNPLPDYGRTISRQEPIHADWTVMDRCVDRFHTISPVPTLDGHRATIQTYSYAVAKIGTRTGSTVIQVPWNIVGEVLDNGGAFYSRTTATHEATPTEIPTRTVLVPICETCGDTTDEHVRCDVCGCCADAGCECCHECYRPTCECCATCLLPPDDCSCCPYCGETDSRWQHECDECGRNTCEESCDCGSGLIMGYGAKPHSVTFFAADHEKTIPCRRGYPEVPDNEPYLGMEIECEAINCAPREVASIWNESGRGWSTYDGSLSNGAECKTHPSTYAFLRESNLSDTLLAMAREGARAWGYTSCGLHIHVSRKAFASKAHQWRYAHAIVTLFKSELVELAGRKGTTHYCEFPSPENRNAYLYDRNGLEVSDGSGNFIRVPEMPTKIIAGKQQKMYREVAVNIENSTIELRFWKGTLNPDSVLGAAAVSDALIHYTEKMTFAQVKSVPGWDDFTSWCAENLDATQQGHIGALCDSRGVSRGALPKGVIVTPADSTESETN